jgi:flagellar protein FliS
MTYGYSRGAQQYQQIGVSSAEYADPHRLVQMLLEGALARLAYARGAIERGEVGEKGIMIGKAIAIIGGLQGSLNQDTGGEIAANLAALYDYMQHRLVHANLKNDIEAIEEVATLLREIKQGWDAMPADARGGGPE